MAAAVNKERREVAEKNKYRKELDSLLKQLDLSVMSQAKGEEAPYVVLALS